MDLLSQLDLAIQQSTLVTGLNRDEAADAAQWALVPKSYIFSFTTTIKMQSIRDATMKWYEDVGQRRTPSFPCLPTVIATQGTIGLLNDTVVKFTPDKDELTRIQTRYGEDARLIMGFWSPLRQFGWIAWRLLYDVTQRLGLPYLTAKFELTIDGHMPPLEYFDEDCKGQPNLWFVWERKSYEAVNAIPAPLLPGEEIKESSSKDECPTM